jgi:hypothetical protein
MQKRVKLGGRALGGLALGLAVMAAPAPALATGTAPAAAGTPVFGPKPAGVTFAVTPLAGQPGSTVSLSGNGCTFDGTGGTVSVLVGADAGIPVPDTTATSDGRWTTSATVPAGAPDGRRQVLVRCVDPSGRHAWIYDESVYFVATPGEAPAVEVSDLTLHQGSTVTVRGTGCLVRGVPGHLDVLDLFAGTSRLHRTAAAVGADGSWQVELAVPGDAVIGTSPVGAHCLAPNSSSIEVFYIPAIVTVSAAVAPSPTPGKPKPPHAGKATPAKPVWVTPRFTG